MGDQPDSPFEEATPMIPPLKGARGMFKIMLQGSGVGFKGKTKDKRIKTKVVK
jgi:hypothetical protein